MVFIYAWCRAIISVLQRNSLYRAEFLVKIRCAMFLYIVASGAAAAQSMSPGLAESYLQRPVGSRALGLAGAYTAVSNEPNAIFFNPAGIGFLPDNPQFSLSGSPLALGRTQGSIAYGQEIMPELSVGAGVNTLMHPSFIGRNAAGQEIGTLSNEQYTFAVGAAWSNSDIALGVTGKYLLNTLTGAKYRGTAFVADFGAKVNMFDLFTIGASIQNIGGRMNWTGASSGEQTPFTFRGGAAVEIGLNEETYQVRSTVRGEPETVSLPATKYALITLDVVAHQHDKTPSLLLGGEYADSELFAVRAGMSVISDNMGKSKFFPFTVWGAGVSIIPPIKNLPFQLQIEYALSGDAAAGTGVANTISLLMEF